MMQPSFDKQWRTDVSVSTAIVCVSGCMLPIVLLPIVRGIGYSVLMEELAKEIVIFVWIAPLARRWHMIVLSLVLGTLFGVSESVLYLPQILQQEDVSFFVYRTLHTVPMHAITALIMVMFGWAGRSWFFMGWGCAVVLHTIFNLIAW